MNRFSILLSALLLAACGKSTTDSAAPAANATSSPPAAAAPVAATAAVPTTTSAASAPGATAPAATPLVSADEIGYPTVAATREAISARKDVEGREDDGWLIVADRAAFAFWSFAPPDHAAYPAVVKRTIHDDGGKVSVAMAILCEGQKAGCDELRHQFDDINERMRADLQHQADTQKKK
jgi:hypothetical protein